MASQRGIDNLLRNAGYPRHDGRTGLTKYSVGYIVTQQFVSFDGRDFMAVLVHWDGGAYSGSDSDRERNYEALNPLAETLTAAGHKVERASVVTPLDDESWEWPCLIIPAAEGT